MIFANPNEMIRNVTVNLLKLMRNRLGKLSQSWIPQSVALI